MPATPYDIAFLRVLMNRALTEKTQALRCVQLIDERAQRGQPTNARALVVELGLLDSARADELDLLAREELQRSSQTGVSATSTGIFRASTQSGVIAPAAVASGTFALPPPAPLPGGPRPLPGGPRPLPPTQSGILPGPATQSGVIASPATQSGILPLPPRPQPLGTQSQLIAPATAGTQSGVLRVGATPPARPASLPPLPSAPPPPASTPVPAPAPYKVAAGVAPSELGELTMADGSMARIVAGKQEADGEQYYDLAENGQGLEAYESGPKLGRGPVGLCYLGRKKLDRSPVVVKVISRRFDEHPTLLADVLGDLQAWIGFRHPSVAATLAKGISNGRNVVVFEQARGQPLAAVLEKDKKPLEPRHAMRAVYDVASALAAAHERGQACGDVSAAKVYWDGQRAQLADLGLARASCLASGFGQYGMTFGHPAYLAPEVLQERLTKPTPQVDVYALGILFYEILCGARPFQGEGVDLLGKHLEAPLPPPPASVSFNTAVAGLILRMTAKSPTQRLPDAKSVVLAITQLLEGKPINIPGAPARPAAPAAQNRLATSGPSKAISTNDWGLASQRVENKNISDKWTVSRIEQAPPVGPSDLSDAGSLSELGPTVVRTASVTGRLPRELLQDDPAPQVPGGPKVGEKIGRGPAGTTYEGQLPGAGPPIVVKVLSKKFGKHPELIKRILDGVRAAASFTHPGAVRVVRALQVAGRDMVIFEKIAGKTLREAMAAGPLPPAQATARVLDLARTLEAARRQGLSHGDVRPEKVFIDDAGRTRLTDFGLAEAAALGAGFGGVGVPFGHPTYLAPEVVQERKPQPDEKADLYSLGILYYELVCGRPPFQAPDPRKVLRQHLEAVIPPPPDGVTIPAAVAELILRMTAKDPARRPQSMTDLVARLQQVAAAAEAPPPVERSDLDSLETGTSEPFTGGTSEPFDTGSEALLEEGGDPVDSQAWGRESLELSRPSGEWDKNKIIAAPKVGPEEWTPDDSEDRLGSDAGPSGSSLRTAAAKAGAAPVKAPGPFQNSTAQPAPKDALMAAIEAAAATKESTADGAPAPAAEGAVPSAKASGRRKRPAAAKAEAGEAGNKKVLFLGAAGALVLVLVAAFAFGGSGRTAGGGKTTETSATIDVGPSTATQRPPDTEPDPVQVAKDKRRDQAKAAGVKYFNEASELVNSQRYRDVVQLKASLPKDLLEEPVLSEKVAEIDEAMKRAVDDRLGREGAAIEAKLAAEDWDGAQADLRKTQQWVPTPDAAAPLVAKVKAAVDARDALVRDEDTGEQVDVATFKNDLEARCKGMANGFVYPNGGVVLNYPTADETLLADLTNVAGPDKVTLDPGDGGKPGILLRSTAKPVFVVLPLAFKQLVDVTVDLVIRKAGSAPKVALLQGFRPMTPRGIGLLWGIQQASIADPRDGLKFITKPLPALPTDGAPIRLRLRFPRRSTEQVEVSGFLRLPGRDVPADKMPAVNLTKLEGQVGVWVEDAEVAIIGLQVRGIVDPAANR